jgi:hypothetical protein
LTSEEDACRETEWPAAACAAKDPQDPGLAVSANVCARLFPHEYVMQAACKSSCAGAALDDAQDCAFTFSRSLREIPVDRPEPHPPVWPVMVAVLVCAACWAAIRFYRGTRYRGTRMNT